MTYPPAAIAAAQRPARLSAEGRALLKRFEGCELEAYQDVAGVWTIGYGWTHDLLWEGRRFDSVADAVAFAAEQGRTVTIKQAYADELLKLGLQAYETAVLTSVTVPLAQHEFDALVSLCWNIGRSALRDSTLVRKLNAEHRAEAADQFLRWHRAGGQPHVLTSRREVERRVFLQGHDEVLS